MVAGLVHYERIVKRIENFPVLRRILYWMKPQNIFLVFALTWGISMVFITPPIQVPDENSHFLRAYQFSTFQLLPDARNNLQGGVLPSSLIKMIAIFGDIPFNPDNKAGINRIDKARQVPLNSEQTKFIKFPNSSHYTPIPYIPQAITFLVLRTFDVPPIYLLYAGRISNLMVWILLVYFAIVFIPICKWLMLVLALLPMSVFQAASLSPDVLINGMSFLIIAIILRLAFDKTKKISKYDLVFVLTLIVLLTLSKNAYFFLILLVLLIPTNKFPSSKKYKAFVTLSFLVTALALMLGGYFVNLTYQEIDISKGIYATAPGYPQDIFPYQQLERIILHPIQYLKVMVHSFSITWSGILKSYIGVLGWLDTPLPSKYFKGTLIILFLLVVTCGNADIKISIKARSIILLSVCAVVVVICTLLYLSWTPLGGDQIHGFQGRYFIPVGPLACMLFYNRYFIIPKPLIALLSIMFILFSVFVMTSSLISRYYIS